ncbi:cobaltochelatase subunit CobN [Candidatus Frankia alpina]|uniref:Cobaltochelatase subunit CobN n=1 Tax=Candidatus Frankia alpina TaxID=2699483 RepID=A0A4S5EPH8_9ACTN|nr:cobaltochelatase subunit CobN [Candidatus Frankia alpina]
MTPARSSSPDPAEGELDAVVLLLSTSDTDLLSARASGARYRLANPARLDVTDRTDLDELTDGVDVVVVRILGGRRMWEEGLAALLAGPRPVVVLGGERAPDAELMAISTVPAGICAEAHAYLAEGGPANLGELHRFLADTLLLTGGGFAPPVTTPAWGVLDRDAPDGKAGPVIGVLYYRAHHVAGNTMFVEELCAAVERAGGAALPVYCASLRTAEPALLATLGRADALVVTVLAAGGSQPARAAAGGDDEAWDVGALAALDIPILQGLCLTGGRAAWADSDDGLSPLDAATQVAIPEFDGRLITVPFSFKEVGADGLTSYVADPERADRVAGIAVAHGRLRHVAPPERRVALMLSAYPTKHSRIGNAVGLDTPASTVRLLREMRAAGYDIGPDDGPDALAGVAAQDGDALIHSIIAAGGQDPAWLSAAQLAGNPVRISAADYRAWYDTLPADLRGSVERHWGPPPGELYVDRSRDQGGEIVLAALRAGNVVLLVQPPRGFGENPVAIYHDPDLAPSHHYLAAYRWLAAPPAEGGFGAHAVVHLGKHGTLEWLPGKTVGMSASCPTDAALGNLPLIYPFLVNDPGEGTQAKRRAHATLVDHLIPPMARAESYGDLARLEQLLDEHASIAAMDPAKLPAIRAQIWTLIQAARLDHDLGLADRPHDAEFDDFLLHVDGWLCEVKDAQIRDGLHVLGVAPTGQARVNLVLAMLRARQMWGGQRTLPGLREALGLAEDDTAPRGDVDAAERTALALVTAMEDRGWAPEAVPAALDAVLPTAPHPEPEPAAGPEPEPDSAADPAADSAAADPTDPDPRREAVGLSVWGTSAMRTSGDDVAEVLALLGIRPVWDDASRRVSGLEPIGLAELGRPRIDVTVRISGFFRDAFPHVVAMLDDAVRMAAALDEPDGDNHVRAHARADLATHGDERRATLRIFGSKPGAYGAGLLPLIDSRNWRDDADLAEVYATWGGYAYGRGVDGTPARADMEAAYRRIAVAAKNVDTREHDIADSDDYFQYHGGMVAAVRALTGRAPAAYIGDSTRPEAVRTRTLTEETSRVFRARVVNPRWLAAMRRHGYKGAFEMAATVDYLFGYDATAGVVADWMYERLAETYALDADSQKFFAESNPWALHGITERLLEAAARGLWQHPQAATLDALQELYLRTEGDLEDGPAGGGPA